jgi:hypothetical protein
MEEVVRGILGSIVLAELCLMMGLLLAWRVTGWLLGPRGMRGALAACPNCGWHSVAAAQTCPVCRLAPEDSRFALPQAPDERPRRNAPRRSA